MISNFRFKIVGFILIPGILMLTSWPPIGWSWPLFAYLVPLLLVATDKSLGRRVRLASIFMSLFLCSVAPTFWIAEVSIIGAIIAWVTNSILLTLPFVWLVYGKEKVLFLVMFIAQWMVGEYIQLYADFGYPAMVLGNGLASMDQLINWYSFTGVLGGTLWILIVNVALFKFIKSSVRRVSGLVIPTLSIVIPLLISIPINSPREYGMLKTLVVHPNVNCYNEKFVKSNVQLLNQYVTLIKESDLKGVELILLPETAITDMGWVSDLPNHYLTNTLLNEFSVYPNLNIISGAISYSSSKDKVKDSFYSEQFKSYLVAYNSAISVNFGNGTIALRHKEKRVPFEEYQPYSLLDKLISSIYTSVTNKTFATFSFPEQQTNVGKASLFVPICYEIQFGDFLAERSVKSNALCFIMNEGWYDNFWASNQFWAITKLRALELGRSILVSSNRGTSGLVNPDSSEIKLQENVAQTISINLPLRKGNTFYGLYGDLIVIPIFIIYVIGITVTMLSAFRSGIIRK